MGRRSWSSRAKERLCGRRRGRGRVRDRERLDLQPEEVHHGAQYGAADAPWKISGTRRKHSLSYRLWDCCPETNTIKVSNHALLLNQRPMRLILTWPICQSRFHQRRLSVSCDPRPTALPQSWFDWQFGGQIVATFLSPGEFKGEGRDSKQVNEHDHQWAPSSDDREAIRE